MKKYMFYFDINYNVFKARQNRRTILVLLSLSDKDMMNRDCRIHRNFICNLMPLELLSDSFLASLIDRLILLKALVATHCFTGISRDSLLAWTVSLTFKRDLMHTA